MPFMGCEKRRNKTEKETQDLLVVDKDFNKKLPCIITETSIERYIFPLCCHPIPGDDILGYIDNKGRIEIHKRACPVANRLKSSYGNRILDAKWNMHGKMLFDATIEIRGIDRHGLLRDVAEVISGQLNIDMRKLVISGDDGVFDGTIELLEHSVDLVIDGG